jgi:hypothetical protein
LGALVVTPSIVLVRLENGLLIPHTLEEYARLMKGVDMEAALILGKPSGGGTYVPPCVER